jgi:hypothetical protein
VQKDLLFHIGRFVTAALVIIQEGFILLILTKLNVYKEENVQYFKELCVKSDRARKGLRPHLSGDFTSCYAIVSTSILLFTVSVP